MLVNKTVVKIITNNRFVPVVLLLAFVLRLLWIVLVNSHPVSDFACYDMYGVYLANGKGYIDSGSPTAYWAIGYPAFLGILYYIFGHTLFIAKFANVAMAIGVLILSYVISSKLFQSSYIGKWTLLLLAFYPNHIAYTSLLSAEILFLFLLLLGFLILQISGSKMKLVSLSGIVFGLACLVKPVGLFVPAISVLSMRTRRIPSLIVIYLSLGVTLLPLVIRNYNVFGHLTLLNNGGVNLLCGNNQFATGKRIFNDELAKLFEDVDGEYEKDQLAKQIALKYISEHPVRTFVICFKKFYYLYRSDVDGISWNLAGVNSSYNKRVFFLIKVVAQGYYMLIGIAFLFGVFVLFTSKGRRIWSFRYGSEKPVSRVGLYIILYFTVIYMIFFGMPRFHFPMMPWIIMYIGVLLGTAHTPQ